MGDRNMTTDKYGLNKGGIINGQKILIDIISGTTSFTVLGMHQFFRRLAT